MIILAVPEPRSYQIKGYRVKQVLQDFENLQMHIVGVIVDTTDTDRDEFDYPLTGADFAVMESTATTRMQAGDSYRVATRRAYDNVILQKLGNPAATIT